MGWMDRFRKKNDADGATGDDRAAIVEMVRQEFARRGRELVPDGSGGLRGIDGSAFGTGNIEATLRNTPREHWQDAIAHHVRIMDGTIDASGPRSLAEVQDRLYLRLRPLSMLPQPPEYDSPVLPGIVGMVTIDHPEHTEELGGIDSLGSTWEEIRALAIANIRALPPMQHDRVLASAEHPDSGVHVFVTDDFFGPSRFFALDQLLAQIGSPQPAPGLLVAVPHRHMIAIHEITGTGVVHAMNGIVNLASAQFASNPGPITPEVFYVGADGRTQQVTARTDTGVTVRIEGAIADTFAQVGITEG